MKKEGFIISGCMIILGMIVKASVASPDALLKRFFTKDVPSTILQGPLPVAEMKPFAGRLAYSADGNYHDEDDIAANSFALMLLAKSGYKHRLVHFEYGNHIWYTRLSQSNQLDSITKEAAARFGFDPGLFFNCVGNRLAAYHHLKDEILASGPSNHLSILGAGPMHTIYQAIKLASEVNPGKLKFITLISHSPATGDSSSNNEHGLYDNAKGKDPMHKHDLPEPAKVWDDIVKDFPSVKLVIIRSQNGPPDVKLKGYDFCVGYPNINDKWMSTFPDKNVQWVWKNMNDVFKFKADVSDAGMLWYWLTGGDQYGNFEKVKNAFTNTFLADQNFNDESIGAKPKQWNATTTVIIQDMPDAVIQNRGICINDKSATQPGYVTTIFPGQPSGMVIDFDIMFLGQTANDVCVTLANGNSEIVLIKASGNILQFRTSAGQWENIGTIRKNHLQHISIDVTLATGICTIVLDGRIVREQVKTPSALAHNVNQVKITTGKGYMGKVYFDNLKVYSTSVFMDQYYYGH